MCKKSLQTDKMPMIPTLVPACQLMDFDFLTMYILFFFPLCGNLDN